MMMAQYSNVTKVYVTPPSHMRTKTRRDDLATVPLLSTPGGYKTGRKVYTAPPLRQDMATIASPHVPLSAPPIRPRTAMAIGWSGITPRLRVAPVRAQ